MAIEPNPDAFEHLEENIKNNDLRHIVQSYCKCISKNRGILKFAFVAGKPEYSSIASIVHPSVSNDVVRSLEVDAVPLIDIIKDRKVSVLFLDTEGAEDDIISGAEELLMRDMPTVFFECSDPLLRKFGSNSELLERRLISIGYIVRDGLRSARSLRHPFNGEAVAYPADRGQKGT